MEEGGVRPLDEVEDLAGPLDIGGLQGVVGPAELGDRPAVDDGVDPTGERTVGQVGEAHPRLHEVARHAGHAVVLNGRLVDQADDIDVAQPGQQALPDHTGGAGQQDGPPAARAARAVSGGATAVVRHVSAPWGSPWRSAATITRDAVTCQ